MDYLKSAIFFMVLFSSIVGVGQEERNVQLNFEQLVLEEVNLLRTNPLLYAEKRLESDFAKRNDNGAYRFLKKMKPVKTLQLNKTLGQIAMEYAQLLSRKNALSHTYKGNPMKRANDAGYFGSVGENLAGASDEKFNATENPQSAATEFVKLLVIDKGVKDLGHRKILVEPRFTELGIGFFQDKDKKIVNYFVQEFGNRQ